MRMFLNLPQFWESRLLRRTYIGQSFWRLGIVLRVLLVPRDPEGERWESHLARDRDEFHRATLRGAENTEAPCRSWLSSEWATFPESFKTSVEMRWNNRLRLRLDPQRVSAATRSGVVATVCRELGYPPDRPLDFDCELEIDPLLPNQRDSAHAILDVVHLEADTASFRSYVQTDLQLTPDQTHRYGLLTHHAVENRPNTVGSEYSERGIVYLEADYVTAAHEVGHLLTLQHPVCAGNESRCYGETEEQQRQLMGMGSDAVAYYGYPWVRSMRWLSDIASGWEVVVR